MLRRAALSIIPQWSRDEAGGCEEAGGYCYTQGITYTVCLLNYYEIANTSKTVWDRFFICPIYSSYTYSMGQSILIRKEIP